MGSSSDSEVTVSSGIWANIKREWRDRKGESKERVGFYSYDWSNSIYFQVAITLYIPILFVKLASGNIGLEDCGNVNVTCDADSCNTTTIQCTHCVVNSGTKVWNGTFFESTDNYKIEWGGQMQSAFSFASYVLSMAGAAQAVAFIVLGTFADYKMYRKPLLIFATILGAVPSILFILCSTPDTYVMASIFAILSNMGAGLSTVYYTSYLPIMTERHIDVKRAEENGTDADGMMDVTDKASNFISVTGFFVGYIGGLLGILISFGITLGLGSNLSNGFLSERVNMLFVGVWWLVFSFIFFFTVKDEPGRAHDSSEGPFVLQGLLSTWRLLKHAAKKKNTIAFIIIYFFYSDSYSTIGTVGILFGQTELCMSDIELGILAVEVVAFCAIGLYGSLWMKNKWKLTTKTMIIISLSFYAFLSAWGILGIWSEVPIGLKNPWDMYVFALLHGIALGPVQSYSRTLYADLSEKSREAEYFAFFEITDRCSSFLGPLIVAVLSNYNIRYSFIYLFGMTVIPMFALVCFVNHREGMIAVGRLEAPKV